MSLTKNLLFILLFTVLILFSTRAISQCGILEDFESSSPWPFTPWNLFGGTISSLQAHTGNKSVLDPGWVYRTDITIGNPGDKLTSWVYMTGTGRYYFGFGSSSGGCHSFVLASNTSELIIMRNQNWNYTNLITKPHSVTLNKWMKMEVDWVTTEKIECTLYDSDGKTILNTISTTISGLKPGGIAMRAFGDQYVDDISWNFFFAKFVNLPPVICMDSADIILHGDPSGGTFQGLGITDSIFNSVAAGSGTHQIIYTFNDTCYESDTQTVVVHASPKANFSYIVSGPVVSFTDMSTDAVDWAWDFDDGSKSTIQNVTHYFLYGGIYNVMLTVAEDSFVCYDSKTVMLDMTHLEIGDPIGDPQVIISPNPVTNQLSIRLINLGESEVEIELYNILGELVRKHHLTDLHNNDLDEFDLSDLPRGIYLVQVKAGEKIFIEKLVRD
ncbi:MAG: T9SS type A sorting domain-containing protein [Bacteroidetes bacterium]|nr:T9SS type A sorting domain-containing protein [Bacteroidota bacterium]